MVEQDEGFDVILNNLVRMAIKRRWWLLAPTVVVALGACMASMVVPNRYESEATILVEHQQVPERYVTPNSTSDIREALLIMTDAILSRTQLLQIIDEYGLYPSDRKRLDPEELVDLMRSKVTIKPTGKGGATEELNAFKVSYTGADPHLVQEVTNRLTTLFIQENLKSREQQSAGTTSFLDEQLQIAAADLKQQEDRVRNFKMRYLGQLPEQQQGNLQILGGLHAQLQNTMASLGQAHQKQVYLESLISQYQSLTVAGAPVSGTPAARPSDATKAELTRLRNARAELLARYTAKYPDVVRIDEQIKETEALLAASTEAPKPTKEGTVQEGSRSARPVESDATIAQLKSQLEANRLEIENSSEEKKRIEARIAEYQARLNLTPVREGELADLLRGYEQSKRYYDDLLKKKTESELATSLERRQQGQRFRIIDPPSLPTKPSTPDHVKISLAGLAAGLALGVALACLIETRDHTLRDEHELSRIFTFPLVVGVPVLLSKAEQRRRSRGVVLEWLVGTTLCLLVCATEFYIYRRG